jgi:hypothetical protein
MKNLYKITVGIALALFVCLVTARADYIDLPIKWSQTVGVSNSVILGVDRLSDHTANTVMANDWLCDGSGPIVAVRWWGSYIGSSTVIGTGYINNFDLSIHASDGSESTHPFSSPTSLFAYYQNLTVQQEFVGFDTVGDAVYRYDAYLPMPFYQVYNTEYFLDIDRPTGENWGWHEAALPWPVLDWAAVGTNHNGPWETYTPYTELAFELMIPEPSTIALLGLGGLALLWRKRH